MPALVEFEGSVEELKCKQFTDRQTVGQSSLYSSIIGMLLNNRGPNIENHEY